MNLGALNNLKARWVQKDLQPLREQNTFGNIRTHITADGYFTKGMRQWFYVNGPLVSGDLLKIRSLDENKSLYQLICDKKKIK